MKYRLLLLGTSEIALDDIFRKMREEFDMLSTTLHEQDIYGHLHYFQPHALVYCLRQENRENILRFAKIWKESPQINPPVVVIGDSEDCEQFEKNAGEIDCLILKRPLTATMISSRIRTFLVTSGVVADEAKPVLPLQLENIDRFEKSEKVATKSESKSASGMSWDETARLFAAQLGAEPTVAEKKRVLIVDDDIRMLKVLKAALGDDYTPATAVNGSIALRFLESKPVDLILLDYEMPDMNGPEVLSQIRKRPEWAHIPVLFLTGASEREKIQKALAMKPQGYLLKPVDRDELIDRIREFIG